MSPVARPNGQFSSPRNAMRALVSVVFAAFVFVSSSDSLDGRNVAYAFDGEANVEQAEPNASLPRLTVGTFNIRYANPGDGLDLWALRKDSVAQLLVSQEVDLVGLQEVLQGQLNDLRRHMPDYDSFGVGRDDGKSKGEFSPILFHKKRLKLIEGSTRWLSTTPEVPGSKSWDAAITRIATRCEFELPGSGRRFVAYNTHFDHRGTQARLASAKLLRAWLQAERLPVVLTGDFNCRVTDAPLVELTAQRDGSRRFFDTRELAAKAIGPDSTWNGFKAIEAGQRIDFVLVDRKWDVEQHVIDERRTATGRFPSDHLPVIVRGQDARN